MTLISEAGLGCDGGNSLAGPEQFARVIEPAREPESMRRHAAAFGEHPGKTFAAHSHSRGNLAYWLVAIRGNERGAIYRCALFPSQPVFTDQGS